ncbi:MAG TPA: anti-sigma factor [Streptosporangiaceae bacterium]
MSDDDRIDYLAGGSAGALDPAELADLDDLRALLADPSAWAEPGPGLEDTVTAAVVRAAASAGPGRSVPAGVTQPRRSGRPRITTALGSGRPRIAWLTGLAAAAAAAVIAVVVTLGGGSNGTQFQAALVGTALAPSASAQVTMVQTRSGWRITLQGHGLPRLDNGYYYEAWLKNPAGILVPIGTFNQPDNVTLWAGVPPTQFPNITITRQRADGNPASSGQRVLVGVAHPAH